MLSRNPGTRLRALFGYPSKIGSGVSVDTTLIHTEDRTVDAEETLAAAGYRESRCWL